MKGGDQLLLREYWPEVVRIGGKVVVLRALGVDVRAALLHSLDWL